MQYLAMILTAIGLGQEVREDAKFTASLDRQLEFVKARTYDIKYPDMKARRLLPVSNEVDSGAETIVYQQWDVFGAAQVISNFADDLKSVDVLVEEFISKVHSLGISYSWSIQDLRRSALTGARLDSRKAAASRRAHETAVEEIAAFGIANGGISGFLNNANVPVTAAVTGNWIPGAVSGALIIADMNALVNAVLAVNQETFIPDTLILPQAEFQHIASKVISTTGDTQTTVLEAFLKASPYITSVESWVKLKTADAGLTKPRMVCYKRDSEVVSLEIPQEYETFPPQAQNLAFKVPTHSRIGGVIIHYPLAVGYMDGLVA